MQNFKSIRGFNDLLPQNIEKVQLIEETIKNILNNSGFKEIRTPIMEYEDLFKRSVGEESDIVSKEMYTIKRSDEKSFTLRPEGTVGVARALLENNLLNTQQKLWYNGYMFRAENPQKGRYRQFQQIGVEAYGMEGINIEIELLYMVQSIFKRLGILDFVNLEINNIGTSADRIEYANELKCFLKPYYNLFDIDFINKFEKNPLRILDSKDKVIKEIIKNAPTISDFINEDSRELFNRLIYNLEVLGINYKINKNLVRGLDYYNDLVFEWTSNLSESQVTICAGSRYDSLIKQIGGKMKPAVGFAIGIERLIMLIETKSSFSIKQKRSIYICSLGQDAYPFALKLREKLLQSLDWIITINSENTSLKSQLKKADKLNTDYSIIIGSTELINQNLILKYMKSENAQLTIAEKDLLNYLV